MISYSLNTAPIAYNGGSILPTSYQTPTSTEGAFYQTLNNTLSMIDPTGVVSTVTNLLGIGPDSWASVESRFRTYFEAIKQEVDRRLNSANSLADLTDADRFLSVATAIYADTSYWDSENSIKGHALVGSLLKELQDGIRQQLSKSYQLTPKSDTSYPGVYKDPKQNFIYGNKGAITYMVYTNKSETRDPAQTIDVNGNPIQNVGTTPDVKIPTDSPYFEDKPKENESSFNWLYVIIPAVAFGLWKLGEWAYKKLKK
ncbi:hypothetical protein [Tenacibaculum sp.]|uniref:hypothetical protein n=1 Tax=Tenacibaculum sp. TaxID=1906242 RepID=UPI003AA84652